MIKKWLCNKTLQIWLPVPDHTKRILIIKGSWSGTTNWLFNLINQQLHIDKIYLCAKLIYCFKLIWSNISISNQKKRNCELKTF